MADLSVAQPGPPYFDEEQGAWVLSRYADVLAALREPELRQASPENAFPENSAGMATAPRGVHNALPRARLHEWQAQIDRRAQSMMAKLPLERHVDLVREFVQPWCRHAALVAIGAPSILLRLPARIMKRAATLRWRKSPKISAAEANSICLGLSETVPNFLGSCWLALLHRPSELARLRSEPPLIPAAIDELLRHAGIVHSLVRQASSEIRLGQLTLRSGERVILKLASANRDPAQFPNPDQLDVSRRSKGHLALGAGPHSCPGSAMVRMAAIVATENLVKEFSVVEIAAPVEWRTGTTLCWPGSLPVVLSRRTGAPATGNGERLL